MYFRHVPELELLSVSPWTPFIIETLLSPISFHSPLHLASWHTPDGESIVSLAPGWELLGLLSDRLLTYLKPVAAACKKIFFLHCVAQNSPKERIGTPTYLLVVYVPPYVIIYVTFVSAVLIIDRGLHLVSTYIN